MDGQKKSYRAQILDIFCILRRIVVRFRYKMVIPLDIWYVKGAKEITAIKTIIAMVRVFQVKQDNER